MNFGRSYHKTVFCKGNIFVCGSYDNNDTIISSIEKYSPTTNTWEHVADMTDDRMRYCACAFMDDIFIIGGRNRNHGKFFNSCLNFDTKQKKWKQVVNMNDVRSLAACTVFEGNVVVSGGRHGTYTVDEVNTVEAYDHVAETWSYMPNMIERRWGHSSVSYKNKLFVFGSVFGEEKEPSEVYDSTCKMFVYLKQKSNSVKFRFTHIIETFCIGSKLITLRDYSSTAICYDVEKDEWSEEPFRVIQNRIGFGCTVLPKM